MKKLENFEIEEDDALKALEQKIDEATRQYLDLCKETEAAQKMSQDSWRELTIAHKQASGSGNDDIWEPFRKLNTNLRPQIEELRTYVMELERQVSNLEKRKRAESELGHVSESYRIEQEIKLKRSEIGVKTAEIQKISDRIAEARKDAVTAAKQSPKIQSIQQAKLEIQKRHNNDERHLAEVKGRRDNAKHYLDSLKKRRFVMMNA